MIKNFGQWKVVNDGIETNVGYEYLWISKKDIMARDTSYANTLMKGPSIDKRSLRTAFRYSYKYFHAMTKYTSKSHPGIYKEMVAEFKDVEWQKSVNGNYITQVFKGIIITVYKNSKDRWAWVYDGIYSKSSYKKPETAKKMAYASYYWLYNHVDKPFL